MRRSRSLVLETLDERVLLSTVVAPAPSPPPPIIAPLGQGLVMKLSTDHQIYRRGQPVVIILTETNTSQNAVTVESGPSLGGFFVTRDGRKIWASNSGIQPMFVQVETLQPGQSITQSATWHDPTIGGSAGTVTGHLEVGSQLEGVQPVEIQIRRH